MIENLYFCAGVLLIAAIATIFAYIDKLKVKRHDIEWSKEQSKYIADVIFETSSGVHKSTGWIHYQTLAGSIYNIKRTAREAAESHIQRNFERGYFIDDAGTVYPASRVIKAYVEVKDNEIQNQI